jgi:hypothetical protein
VKYTLSATVTVSAFTVVEADSEAEAIAIARTRGVTIDDRSDGEEEWAVTEADGEPHDIKIDE